MKSTTTTATATTINNDSYRETVEFAPTEIAFRYPGGSWGRKVCKTEVAFDRFVEKLLDGGAEFRTAKVGS